MPELEDDTVSLVVTSPPYWHIKDYGTDNQIGYGQSLHDYLKALFPVWKECFRVLTPGRRLCINIGDQFTRTSTYGRYKVIPIHAEIISQCEQIGFDFMGSIIWQKRTTLNTTGGAPVMGSYPHPPNGIVELDYEHILLFKKVGKPKKVARDIKEASKLTKEEWKLYFSGHWHFGGAKQVGHEAMFPEELPRRLIRMFSFVGETVLDPFLGSGTTAKAALDLARNAVGYEISEEFMPIIQEKVGGRIDASATFEKRTPPSLVSTPPSPTPHPSQIPSASLPILHPSEAPSPSSCTPHFSQLTTSSFPTPPLSSSPTPRPSTFPPTLNDPSYNPRVQDAHPLKASDNEERKKAETFKVTEIVDATTLRLDDGRTIRFLGVAISKGAKRGEALDYLRKRVLGKQVILKFDEKNPESLAYVYLKNHIFINAFLIKSGLAASDDTLDHRLRKKFDSLHASS